MDAKSTAAKRKRKNADAEVISSTNATASGVKTRRAGKVDVVDGNKTQKSAPGGKTTAKAATSKKTTTKKAKTDDDDLVADNDAAPPSQATSSKPKKETQSSSKSKKETQSSSKSKKETESIRTIMMKGVAPVDEFCPVKSSTRVVVNGNDIYDVMLNQTAVERNNNKFYVIQLLESDDGKNYSVWQRWGRVGYDGQSKLDQYRTDLEKAKTAFSKKFHDKTGNQWTDRRVFLKRPGKYDLVEIDYTAKDDEKADTKPKKPKKEPPPSKLDKSLQDLLKLICDIRAMEDAVKEMKYDASKAPLGKLTVDQIKAGYAALKKIEACVENGDSGRALVEACNEFYTRIPHYFGMKTPPLIRTREEIKEKIQLLEALSDIEVAIRTLEAGDREIEDVNPVDKHYDSMKCCLTSLEKDSDEFKLVNDYLTTTHAPTHSTYKMELLEAYRCSKDGEDEKFKDVGNRMLLWHGSRLTNWYGILSQGLRIAPPEAPVTGYMFGKGVYFADLCSKSANYCFTTRERNIGLLVLCEVALGKPRELANADYNADRLPSGFHSTKGVGRMIPDEVGYKTLENGCIVPSGKPVESENKNCALMYNEYIVYDTSQIKMKYLLQVKFLY